MKPVLIIRKFDNFSRKLAENGLEIINLPMIETKPLEDLSDFETKLAELKNYDGFFLTSRMATQILVEKLRGKNINFSGKGYVLGAKSFEILKALNLDLFYNEAANTAREMLDSIPLTELRNKHFLFVRGEISLQYVPEYLKKLASVEEVIVYQTGKITVEIDKINELREKFGSGEIAAACFFSPSGAESFLEQFGAEVLHQTKLATIGKTTAEYFERRNLNVGFVSSKSNAGDFAVELIDYLRNR